MQLEIIKKEKEDLEKQVNNFRSKLFKAISFFILTTGFLFSQDEYRKGDTYSIDTITVVGLKNFRKFCNKEVYLKEVHPSYRDRNCSTHPHNLFFEIISELGFFGFIVFCSIFGYFFFISFKNSFKYKNIFLFGNTIFLITYFIPFLPRGSFFTNWNAMLFWTVFGISVYLVNNKNKYA